MWEDRRGEGLDSGLSHGGHTWSSLGDELTCCRVRRLITQRQIFNGYMKSTSWKYDNGHQHKFCMCAYFEPKKSTEPLKTLRNSSLSFNEMLVSSPFSFGKC